MAGSFFHLWLAQRTFPLVFAQYPYDRPLQDAFAAGSVGPDIGFFPGGPFGFSHRAHLERCGDFLRQLLAGAQGERERAFAAGWGLHVYTDMAVHPWVEAEVAAMLAGGIEPANPDLWHMRLEWGIDCRLLQAEGMDFLWQARVEAPTREDGTSLLGRVGGGFYGDEAEEARLSRGWDATVRWLRRIPLLLLWGGHTRPKNRRPNPVLEFAFAKVGGKVVGEWLEGWSFCKDAAALSRPLVATSKVWRQLEALGELAMENFVAGWEEGFSNLGNPDLYLGVEQTEIADG